MIAPPTTVFVRGALATLLAGAAPASLVQREAFASQTLETFTTSLDLNIPQYLLDFRVPGAAVAVIEGGRVAFLRGYGYADLSRRRPVTGETGFNIGSISKTVAAWGVMRLVEDGKLDLDAPAERYLRRWHLPPSEFDAAGVTIRRLLSHTAGLSLHGYPGFGPDDELPTLEQSLSGATNGSGDVRLILEPGTRWRYSGGGFTLLQLVVEEVTGRRFSQYLAEAVLEPLGMTRSSYELTPDILAGSSVAYDEFAEVTPNPRFTAQAAAGLHTTIEDLARFAAAVLSDPTGQPAGRGVLAPSTIALMTTPAPASDGRYGLGYSVDTLENGMIAVGHGGANRGWHAVLSIVPRTGDGFAMVTNGSNGWAVHRQVWCDWVQRLTGTRPPCRRSIAMALLGPLLEGGVTAAIARYRALKEKPQAEYVVDEWELNRLGYVLLARRQVQDAIALFRLNVEEYPDAPNPYDSLGEAYMVAGETALAIANYRKSLELDPGNTNAIAKLKALERR